jgi:hypothetical protein
MTVIRQENAIGIAIGAVAAAAVAMALCGAASPRQNGSAQAPAASAAGPRSFEIVPLETVSETSANAAIGDVNGDGCPDIVLAKGRHWPVPSRVYLGDCHGHFRPGPDLPSEATKTYSASLADMTRSGHLDIVLSNDEPEPKLVLVNDKHGNFRVAATYGDPKWSTRNAAFGDLKGDGYPDIVVANRMMPSQVCLNDGHLHFRCTPLAADHSSAASVAIADMDGDGWPDVVVARSDAPCIVMFNRPTRTGAQLKK